MAAQLAPDQRAVVQLVLQQERSYDDLAGLLGISVDAVRARAHAGLDRLGPTEGLSDEERAEIADFLLGQSSVSQREAVRGLLGQDERARAYAEAVADALEETWPDAPLPAIPAGSGAAAAVAEPEYEPEPEPEAAPEPDAEPEDEPEPEPEPTREQPTPAAPRPRPRRDAAARSRPRQTARAKSAGGDGRRSSLLGGAMLIGGLAVVLAVLVIWLFTSGDDEDPASTAGNGTPTATATATATAQPAGAIELRAPNNGRARGQMVIFIAQNGITFQIGAENVPANREGEAYAVWLTGGDRPRRLGFAPTVGEDGLLATSGPRESDAQRFPQWFADARNVVVSRETTGDAAEPGPTVLRGAVPRQSGQGGG